MKKLIVLITAIVIANVTSAADIAKYSFAFRSADGNGIYNVSAVLHDDKTLKLDVIASNMTSGSQRRFPLPIIGWEQTADLSFTKGLANEIYSMLSVDALSLSNAKIERTFN
jgi:hypothetical protein